MFETRVCHLIKRNGTLKNSNTAIESNKTCTIEKKIVACKKDIKKELTAIFCKHTLTLFFRFQLFSYRHKLNIVLLANYQKCWSSRADAHERLIYVTAKVRYCFSSVLLFTQFLA